MTGQSHAQTLSLNYINPFNFAKQIGKKKDEKSRIFQI